MDSQYLLNTEAGSSLAKHVVILLSYGPGHYSVVCACSEAWIRICRGGLCCLSQAGYCYVVADAQKCAIWKPTPTHIAFASQ